MGDVIQFPRKVKVAQVFNSGLFGLTVENVKKATIYNTSIMLWFSDKDEDATWDLTLEYATVDEAKESYNELLNTLRELRFTLIDK